MRTTCSFDCTAKSEQNTVKLCRNSICSKKKKKKKEINVLPSFLNLSTLKSLCCASRVQSILHGRKCHWSALDSSGSSAEMQYFTFESQTKHIYNHCKRLHLHHQMSAKMITNTITSSDLGTSVRTRPSSSICYGEEAAEKVGQHHTAHQEGEAKEGQGDGSVQHH